MRKKTLTLIAAGLLTLAFAASAMAWNGYGHGYNAGRSSGHGYGCGYANMSGHGRMMNGSGSMMRTGYTGNGYATPCPAAQQFQTAQTQQAPGTASLNNN